MLIGQGRFDLSQGSNFRYSFRHEAARSLIVEFAPDGNGAASGTVGVYLGDGSAAAPYFTASASTLRIYPSPDVDYVTLVPSAGAKGLVTVSVSQTEMGIGIYPFSRGGGGSTPTPPTIVQSAFTKQNANFGLALPAAPTVGNVLMYIGAGSPQQISVSPTIAWTLYNVASLAQYQGIYLGFRPVQSGDTGAIAVSNVYDYQTAGLYELTNLQGVTVQTQLGSQAPALFAAEATMCFAVFEIDGAYGYSGLTSTFAVDYNSPVGSHACVIARRSVNLPAGVYDAPTLTWSNPGAQNLCFTAALT